MYLGAQQLHTEHVQRLPVGVLFSHEDLALHVHESCCRGGGDAVLSGAGLGNNSRLAHLLCQQHLSQHVVDLVGTGVVQILPFQVNFRAAQIPGHLFRII